MIVKSNGVVINPVGAASGISTPLTTLMSFNFYDTSSNWFNNTPWSIADVPNPSVVWGICDGETLPFFQWEGFNCGIKAPLFKGNNEEKSLSVQNVKSEFSIYPNPTSSHITISSEVEFYSVEIVDLFGRIIHSQINQNNSITLDVSKYSSGIYFVRIISNDGANIQKFVKQ